MQFDVTWRVSNTPRTRCTVFGSLGHEPMQFDVSWRVSHTPRTRCTVFGSLGHEPMPFGVDSMLIDLVRVYTHQGRGIRFFQFVRTRTYAV